MDAVPTLVPLGSHVTARMLPDAAVSLEPTSMELARRGGIVLPIALGPHDSVDSDRVNRAAGTVAQD